LTYRGEGVHDERVTRGDIRHFVKRMRADLGGESFPYLWVPEWHPGGHGLHVHIALGQYVPHRLIQRAWGHGFVHIKRLTRGAEAGSLASARRAAAYMAPYVSKRFDAPRQSGLHRYDVAEGFAPRVERVVASTRAGAIASASELLGRPPSRTWFSDDTDDWKGPPAVWVSWDD
jgi:hypothetical protein